ncbi:hypothetical protein ABW19_dt0207502 [Dactylella cylindrospora]|nr:hypothetical protein ABW19_dt0207502 [Dactylella cylindrospora]
MKFNANYVIRFFLSTLVAIACGLGGLAWYIISRYNIPISAVVPILSTFLPPVDLLSVIKTVENIASPANRKKGRPLSFRYLFVHLLLLIAPIVLLTNSAQSLGPSDCQLQGLWRSWFQAKNEAPVHDLQTKLQCCGYKTPLDMAYPFPYKPKKGNQGEPILADACYKISKEKAGPCYPLWEEQVKTAGGLMVASNSVMAILKVIPRATLLH